MQADEEINLDTIEVALDYLGESTEDSSSYGIKASKVTTGLELSILRTPQSIDAITNKQLKDNPNIRMNTIDTLDNSVGVTSERMDTQRILVYARKMEVSNISYDGLNTFYKVFYDTQVGNDTAIYDRVEIVRGASGLMKGAGNPSATINFVRKVPHATKDFTTLGFNIGSWKFGRADVDMSYALNKDRSIRARLNLATQKNATFIDRQRLNKTIGYGVVDFDIADSSILRLGLEASRERQRATSYGGKPYYFKGNKIKTNYPINYNYAPDWSGAINDFVNYFATLRHYFDNDFELELNYAHQDFKQDWHSFYADQEFETDRGNFTTAAAYYTLTNQKTNSIAAKLSGKFEALNTQNEFALSLELNKNKGSLVAYSPPFEEEYFPYRGRFFDGIFLDPKPNFSYLGTDKSITTQKSISIVDNIEFNDKFSAILGLRLTKYDEDAQGGAWWNDYKINKTSLSKYFGLSYEYFNGHTIYTSITDTFQPQKEIDINKKVLDPIVGTNYEIGLKSKFFDDNLLASLALFKAKQDGVAVDAGHFKDGSSYYKPAKGVVNKGFEISANGKITDKFSIYGGYTYTTSRDDKGDKIATEIADKTLKLGVDYAPIAKLNFGANIKWQSKIYTDSTYREEAYYVEQPAYKIVNLHSAYQVTKNLKFQANINNIFNKKHLVSTGLWANYGEPRSFMIRGEYKF